MHTTCIKLEKLVQKEQIIRSMNKLQKMSPKVLHTDHFSPNRRLIFGQIIIFLFKQKK